MFVVRYKELFTLYMMLCPSVYAELFKCEGSIIVVITRFTYDKYTDFFVIMHYRAD